MKSRRTVTLPLVVGFAVLSACSIVTAWWAELGASGGQTARVPGTDIETTTGRIG